MAQRSYLWLLLGLAAFGFAADQASKYGVFRWLYNDGRGGEFDVVPGAFKLLAQFDPTAEPARDCALASWSGEVPPRVNHGALFGLGGEHEKLANAFFATVSVLAALAILIWGTRRAARSDPWLSGALGLILAGTLGNLYDRVVFHGVRDFLYFYLIEWPVFNIADCCLVVGACLLLIQAFFTSPAGVKETAGAESSEPAAASAD